MVVQLLVSGYHAADARAAGGKALGDRVDDDNIVLIALKLQKAHELLAAVDKFAVDLVTDDEKSVLAGDIRHETQLLLGQDGAGGVAGICEHDGAGALVYAGLHALAHGEPVALLGLCGDGADARSGEGHEGGIVGVKRLGDDDLVALVEDAGKGDLKRLGAAGGDEHLLAVYRCVDSSVVVDDGVYHLGNAVGGRVLQNRLGEVFNRLKVGLGGRDVRLADVKVVNLLAVFHGLGGVGSEFSHGRKPAFFYLT